MIKVKFKELSLCFIGESLDDGGALAPPHHVDADGHVTWLGAFGPEESYAHLGSDGRIRRFGEIIGHRDDLIVEK